jgi:3-mercaptopyruvate sulfurtransferase SseA
MTAAPPLVISAPVFGSCHVAPFGSTNSPRVRHYDGGWSEYGSLVDVPVARDEPA